MDRYAVVTVSNSTGDSKTITVFSASDYEGSGDVASERAHRLATVLDNIDTHAFVVGLR